MKLSRQPETAMVVLQDANGRTSRRCVNLRDLDSTMQRHVASGGYTAVSGFREGRAPLHALAPPTARASRRTAEPSRAEVPTPSADPALGRQQKKACSAVAETPMAPPQAEYVAPTAVDPIGNAKTHTYGITTDNGYGTAWDLALPDGSTGMASAKHVIGGDTKYPPIASTPDSDFAMAANTDGVQGGLELASRDAEPGDQVALVTPRQGPLHATVTGTEVVNPEGGGGESFDATTVDRPVIAGDSGSPGVLIKPGDVDHGKVVGTVSCTDESETALVPASTMRELVGAPGARHDAFAEGHGYGHNAALDGPVGSSVRPLPVDMEHDTVQHGIAL